MKVEIAARVLTQIRQHARTSMDAEICGVLIGGKRQDVKHDATLVEHAIAGEGAREGGTHVTFTQETWAHVYKIKDAEFPDDRIVGWYHSHPGFGIFLSDHDLFIHKNFFSDASQIAWVVDPHSEEEGCFVWEKGKIVRLEHLTVRTPPGANVVAPEPDYATTPSRATGELPASFETSKNPYRWAILTLSHLVVLVVGFLISYYLFPAIMVEPGAKTPEHQYVQPQEQHP